MGVNPLFKRFVGSADGYERRPVIQKSRAVNVSEVPEQAPNVRSDVDKYPVICKGKIMGWETF